MRRHRRKLLVFPLLFVLTLLIFSVVYYFRLKKLIIITPWKITGGLEVLEGQNLLLLKESQLKKAVISENNEVKNVTVKKNFPSTLILEIEMRIPIAKVRNDNAVFYLDDQGVLLRKFLYGERQLPFIKASSVPLSIFHKLDWRVKKAGEYLVNLSNYKIGTEQIILDQGKSAFLIFLSDGSKVVTPLSKDPLQVVASLQIIISRFRIEGKLFKSVDFRFDKPIVIQ